jgi:hypothetical protein
MQEAALDGVTGREPPDPEFLCSWLVRVSKIRKTFVGKDPGAHFEVVVWIR